MYKLSDYDVLEILLPDESLKSYKNKKYRAHIRNKHDATERYIYFGDNRYDQYFDKVGHYKNKDHYDDDRLRKFINRFKSKYDPEILNPTWFSVNILWSTLPYEPATADNILLNT